VVSLETVMIYISLDGANIQEIGMEKLLWMVLG
jgi:hypothetical protein